MDFYHANAHEFKYDTLKKYVARPFQDLGATDVFYAGFGNTVFDMHAYHNAGIDLHRMFLIDKQSRIYCLDRKEHEDSNTDVERALDRPKEYAMARGTLYGNGYQDPKLLLHVLDYKKI
jgi:LNS2 (Lipin/Ned1/Smp2)